MKEVRKVELKLDFDEGFKLNQDASYSEMIKDMVHTLNNGKYMK
jgi:hypothetical protein